MKNWFAETNLTEALVFGVPGLLIMIALVIAIFYGSIIAFGVAFVLSAGLTYMVHKFSPRIWFAGEEE
jgi:hypothetical protein